MVNFEAKSEAGRGGRKSSLAGFPGLWDPSENGLGWILLEPVKHSACAYFMCESWETTVVLSRKI